jgi:hypothetical protein
MMNVHDLQIEEEVLPLFDHTHNAFTREMLFQMPWPY